VVLCALLSSAVVSAVDPYKVEYDNLWGGSLFDTFTGVIADGPGNAYAAAVTTVNVGGTRAWKVVKFGPTGSVVWTREINIANQNGVGTSALLGLGPSNSVFGTCELHAAGVGRAVVARLNPATGAIMWQSESGDFVKSPPVISGSRVFALVSSLATGHASLVSRAINSGAIQWSVSLGAVTGADRLKLVVDGAGNPITYVRRGASLTVTKRNPANGAPTWVVPISENMDEPGGIGILKPSENLIVAVPSVSSPRFLLLRGTDGAVLRTESTANVVVSAAAGPADSYYRFEQGLTGLFDFRDANGIPFAQGQYDDDPFNVNVVDPTGQYQFAEARNFIPTGKLEFRLSRCAARVEQFFPFDGPSVVAQCNDVAASGNSVFMVGFVELLSGDVQARLLRVKQELETRPDMFSTLKRAFPTTLNVPAPGILANDAGFFGAAVTVVATTPNGTLNLNADGSFSYLPNPGFGGQDSFTYKLRIGTTEVLGFCIINVISLASVTVPQPDVVGGNNLVGSVNLSGENRNATFVVQLSDNAASVLVTSSVAIKFGMSSAPFNIITSPVTADENCTITGTLLGVTRTAQLLVKRATPMSLTLSTNSLVGGMPFTGTVLLTGKAPTGGLNISLTHSGVEIGMPTSMTVAAGSTSGVFNGTTQPRSTVVTHVITASANGVSRTANLTLNPGGLFGFTITPTTVQGGQNATGRVQTAGIAPPGGTVVNLTVNGSKVTVPPTVTVAAGTQFQTFTITTQAVGVSGLRTVTATFGNVTKTATLTLTP
jgi:hypothetical protein